MVPVLCVFDNEEIGSETKQGAASVFLPETLAAISEALGLSAADHRRLLADSMMLSCDNGHARHPNHPELADTNEAPVLNGGVVVKHSPRYATDGVSAAQHQYIGVKFGGNIRLWDLRLRAWEVQCAFRSTIEILCALREDEFSFYFLLGSSCLDLKMRIQIMQIL